MKKFLILFSFFAMISSASLFAGKGKAIIPSYNGYASAYEKSVCYISNISSSDVVVTVTLYDESGTVVTSGITLINFANSNTEIAAGKTGIISFQPTAEEYGYAVIEWENKGTDDDVVALVAQGFIEVQDGSNVSLARYMVPVNEGRPF